MLMTGCIIPQSSANSHAFEAHFEGQIPNPSTNVDSSKGLASNRSHGYVYLFSDIQGNGLVNVFFSNGDRTKAANFGAQIYFFDQYGESIHKEVIHSKMEKANARSAFERKITNKINFGVFSSVKVEFFSNENHSSFTSSGLSSNKVQAHKLWQYPE